MLHQYGGTPVHTRVEIAQIFVALNNGHKKREPIGSLFIESRTVASTD